MIRLFCEIFKIDLACTKANKSAKKNGSLYIASVDRGRAAAGFLLGHAP
jgi:hypothetical protein